MNILTIEAERVIYKYPAVLEVAVEFMELPKTATGKVQKYLLREKEWAGYDQRIH